MNPTSAGWVGVPPLGGARLASHRGRELTPTRLALLADLPLSGGGIAELAAPLNPEAPPPFELKRYFKNTSSPSLISAGFSTLMLLSWTWMIGRSLTPFIPFALNLIGP